MIDALFAKVVFWTAERNKFARAMPAYGLFHIGLKKLLVAMLVGVQVMLCKSIHWPLSFQSGPRIGSTISSEVISIASYRPPSGAVVRSCAYTPASAANTSASLLKKWLVEMRLGGVSSRLVHPCSGTSSAKSPAAPIDAFTKNRFMDHSLLRT